MNIEDLSRAERMVGLGAMRAVADVSGGLADEEKSALDAVAKALSLDVSPDRVEPASPDKVAATITDPVWRLRVVQALMFVAMIDGDVTEKEVELVDRYAKALDVPEREVKGIHRIVDHQMVRLRVDVARRFPVGRQVASEMW